MKKYKFYSCFFIIFFLLFISCKDDNDIFYKTLTELENKMSKRQLKEFAETNERRPIYGLKFKYLNVYSNEIFSNSKDSSIILYFRKKGINKTSEMSQIIFTSLHRKLNSKKIDLDAQIKSRLNSHKNITDCIKLQDYRLLENNNFKKGDTVFVRMRINKFDNSAYTNDCPNIGAKWIFNNKKDLLIKGIALSKYTYEDVPKLVYMRIKVISLNKQNVLVSRQHIVPGDEFSIVLNYDIVSLARFKNGNIK